MTTYRTILQYITVLNSNFTLVVTSGWLVVTYRYCADTVTQCCGFGSAWIRNKVKGMIRIRINVISWIRIWIRINLQMTIQNVWNTV